MPAGSPPRVRSRRAGRGVVRLLSRITSACAEQTLSARSSTTRFWDHLRVCGADQAAAGTDPGMGGSPPRVRSRRILHMPRMRTAVDHLRVCGADENVEHRTLSMRGSPPRVRSRPKGGGLAMTAKVGNTDHLRVCGADVGGGHAVASSRGSPPRVRSRLAVPPVLFSAMRITSACAEQTSFPRPSR